MLTVLEFQRFLIQDPHSPIIPRRLGPLQPYEQSISLRLGSPAKAVSSSLLSAVPFDCCLPRTCTFTPAGSTVYFQCSRVHFPFTCVLLLPSHNHFLEFQVSVRHSGLAIQLTKSHLKQQVESSQRLSQLTCVLWSLLFFQSPSTPVLHSYFSRVYNTLLLTRKTVFLSFFLWGKKIITLEPIKEAKINVI